MITSVAIIPCAVVRVSLISLDTGFGVYIRTKYSVEFLIDLVAFCIKHSTKIICKDTAAIFHLNVFHIRI